MPATTEETLQSLAALPGVQVRRNLSLASCTRFGIGGPAEVLVDAGDAGAFSEALRLARASGRPVAVIGGGTNLIVADEGFPGIVLRCTAGRIAADGTLVTAEAGAELQALVDFTSARGLKGLETLARIPGWVGAAVYGNAGAYGHSISERVVSVSFTDGAGARTLDNRECHFRYRESVFKRRKDWVILSATWRLQEADAEELRRTAAEITRIRDQKFPPTMKCAGSIFKNLVIADLPARVAAEIPASVVRDGKAPSAWLLEAIGAKGMTRGGIRVADYHANLLFNAGGGAARDLAALIAELKARVRDRFGIELKEEVQYIGFKETPL